MNDIDIATDAVDDLEREIVRTLRAKVDKGTVSAGLFRPERALAVAAAAVVLAGAVMAMHGVGAGDDADVAVDQPAGPIYTTRAQGPAAFAAGSLPAGWTLQQVDVAAP